MDSEIDLNAVFGSLSGISMMDASEDEYLGATAQKLNVSPANFKNAVVKVANNKLVKTLQMSTVGPDERKLIAHTRKFKGETLAAISKNELVPFVTDLYVRVRLIGTTGKKALFDGSLVQLTGVTNLDNSGAIPSNIKEASILAINFGYAADAGTDPRVQDYKTMVSPAGWVRNAEIEIKVGNRVVVAERTPMQKYFGTETGSIVTGLTDSSIWKPIEGSPVTCQGGEQLKVEIDMGDGTWTSTGNHFLQFRMRIGGYMSK